MRTGQEVELHVRREVRGAPGQETPGLRNPCWFQQIKEAHEAESQCAETGRGPVPAGSSQGAAGLLCVGDRQPHCAAM